MSAEWSEFSGNTWTIPAAKSKIKHDRPVALSKFALFILGLIKEQSGDGFLFPANGATGHQERRQKTVYAIRERCGVKDFELHDLRRVVRSGLSDLGVSTDVAELCLGHLPAKLVRRYSPHPSFWKLNDQRIAMEAWGAKLEKMLSSDDEAPSADVLPLRRATA
jgi:integrase